MRLLSPQQLAKQTAGLRDGFYVHDSTAKLIFGGFTKTVSYNLRNNLPIISSFPGVTKFASYNSTLVANGSLCDNLTYNQRQLLKWHNRLGHMDFSRIQKFSRLGLLPRELSTVRPQDYPVCPSCHYGKQKRSHRLSINDNHVISGSDDKPGDCVSMDLIHSLIGGLIPQQRGKPRLERYRYACVFVDHVSNMTFVTFQLSASAEETVESKHAFERFALSHGVSIRKYRADNGSFNTRVFKEAITAANQRIDF